VPGAGELFADARHNLELTKLLRTPTTIEGEVTNIDQNENDKADSQQAAANDQPPGEAGNINLPVRQRADAGPESADSSETLASLASLKDDDDDLCPD
jgi:hypothetical protein